MVRVKTVEYRDYRLVIQVPNDMFGRWQAIIRPPGTRPSLIRPADTSEDHAILDAQSAVDRELDGDAGA